MSRLVSRKAKNKCGWTRLAETLNPYDQKHALKGQHIGANM